MTVPHILIRVMGEVGRVNAQIFFVDRNGNRTDISECVRSYHIDAHAHQPRDVTISTFAMIESGDGEGWLKS